MKRPEDRSIEDWQQELSPEEFHICFQGGTEPPFSGKYNDCKEDGVYRCVACDTRLFESTSKFDSGSGWPSFNVPRDQQSVDEYEDRSHGMVRTEVRCASCGAHLGHVFPDGPPPNGLRYCINSIALRLEKHETS